MLGLCQEVRRNPCRISKFIGDDNCLCWTRKSINSYHAIDLSLCQGNKQIARSENLIHRANGFRPIRQRGNCLRPTQRVNLIYPSNGTRGKDDWINRYRRRGRRLERGRSHYNNFLHACDPRRGGTHQYCRWKRSCPAWNIESHALKRTYDLPKRTTQVIGKPGGQWLMSMEGFDARRGFFECVTVGWRNRIQCSLDQIF